VGFRKRKETNGTQEIEKESFVQHGEKKIVESLGLFGEKEVRSQFLLLLALRCLWFIALCCVVCVIVVCLVLLLLLLLLFVVDSCHSLCCCCCLLRLFACFWYASRLDETQEIVCIKSTSSTVLFS